MSKRVVQAGAVVYRTDEGLRILLVRDTNNKAWVFSKGHLEAKESLRKAALRGNKESLSRLRSADKRASAESRHTGLELTA